MPKPVSNEQPQLAVSQSGPARKLGDGLWESAFRVVNRTDVPVRLEAAWLPHGRFRCEEQSLKKVVAVEPQGQVELVFPVAFREAPGIAVENAFVILRVHWREGLWRILARLTVKADSDGAPEARTEAISVHPVGFSQQ